MVWARCGAGSLPIEDDDRLTLPRPSSKQQRRIRLDDIDAHAAICSRVVSGGSLTPDYAAPAVIWRAARTLAPLCLGRRWAAHRRQRQGARPN